MSKRIFLMCCLSASLFSVQADPFLYTFDGITSNYNLIIDFNEPGILNETEKNDYDHGWELGNYGSAFFDASTNLIYNPEDLVYEQTSNAFYYESYLNGDLYNTESSVNMWKNYEDGTWKSFSLFASSYFTVTDFSVGTLFTATEELFIDTDHWFKVSGNVTLTSITPYSTSTVPETNTMALLVIGMVGLTGLGYRQKKCFEKK